MKFIIDAHLPSSLITYFEGHNVIHTSLLLDGNFTSDKTIISLSISEERIVITKDTDFYYSFTTKRGPYKLVLVKLGNMRLKEIKGYFERNAKQLIALLEIHSFLILEPERIRILE
jgi:predicted nuclease of predicted toxin-antitoxin system